MLKAEKKLVSILNKSEFANIPTNVLINFIPLNVFCTQYIIILLIHKNIWKLIATCLLFLIFYFIFLSVYNTNSQCLLEAPVDTTKIFRKPESCVMCEDVQEIKRVSNLSQLEFETYYAHTGVPVVISDGATSWPAMGLFTFEFFKNIYDANDNNNDDDEDNEGCQFFPYKTEFRSLSDVFNMSPARARLETGTNHWYIGWSNCNNRVGAILRNYYTVPYFLPGNSENIALNWIFMGGPGHGAHMHVDHVIYPSWQAQLNGVKQWRLMPPPECFYQCKALSVHVKPGEIIVLDTNRWYHQTNVINQEVSIAIGSEYD